MKADDRTLSSMQSTLYYNGACPLCRAEMDKLKQCSNGQLNLIDVHDLQDFSGIPDKSLLLERLHLKTTDGHWLTGLDANVAAWQHTPQGKYWRLLLSPLIKPVALVGYRLWLTYYQRQQARNNLRSSHTPHSKSE